MSDLLKVRVSTYDTELEYTVKSKTNGQSLFEQVVQTIGVREVWFFGLEYKTAAGKTGWLDLTKRISKQPIRKEAILKFEFKVKFFPEDVQEIIQEKTIRLFFQQCKSDILSSSLFATADKCVLLASYAAQVRHGDYLSESAKADGYLANDKLLPNDVTAKHTLSREEWEAKVTTFHKNHAGLTKEAAMVEYLKLVQDLEMYGISYFPVINKRGTEVLMGIDSRGINVYNKEDKLNPTISFPWSEVSKVKPTKSSLKIKLVAKQSPSFSVKATQPFLMNDLAVGNHNLFVRRRDPKETLEIQQMKREREEKRQYEKTQNEKLRKEIAEKHKSQTMVKEFEQKFLEMQMTLEEYRTQLEKAKQKIEELEQQLRATSESKEELLAQQEELRLMLETMEKDKELGEAQKEELLLEIAKKQLEIEETTEVVALKEIEAEKLRLEMDEANLQIKDANEKINKVLLVSPVAAVPPLTPPAPFVDDDVIVQNGVDNSSADEKAAAAPAADSRRTSLTSAEVPAIVISPEELENLEIRDREQNKVIEDLTKDLREELDAVRDENVPVDTLERIADENQKEKRTKFKTLREIRSGFAKRRIDTFENM